MAHDAARRPHRSPIAAMQAPLVRAMAGNTTNSPQGPAPELVGLGITLMILGTCASALGMLCLKRANAPPHDKLPWYSNSWFWGGITLFVFTAAGLDIIVFAITPLSLIAPFAGLTIVVSFVFAYFGVCLSLIHI